MTNRVEYDDKGRLDEVVTDGGAHLERLSKSGLFLSCRRLDGSEICVWIEGKVTLVEERPAPTLKASARPAQPSAAPRSVHRPR